MKYKYFERKLSIENKQKNNTLEVFDIDDILLQEIYSLKEKLKIAIYHLHKFDPTFDINDYVHRLNSVDFDTWIEEINGK